MSNNPDDEVRRMRQQYERDQFYAEENEKRMTEAQRKQRERGQYEFEPERGMD
ncbi:MAG: hypothetical protein WC455_20370 [Dehalococcoidia bacterium]|jgi:hypothetical protein